MSPHRASLEMNVDVCLQPLAICSSHKPLASPTLFIFLLALPFSHCSASVSEMRSSRGTDVHGQRISSGMEDEMKGSLQHLCNMKNVMPIGIKILDQINCL